MHFQRQQIKDYEHRGLIDEAEMEEWISKLDRRIVRINKFKPHGVKSSINDKFSSFTLDFPIFSCLTEKELSFVLEAKTVSDFKKNEDIYKKGEKCKYIYFVYTGIVSETVGNEKQYRKTKGGIVNIANLCSPDKTCLTSLQAITYCRLYKIRTGKFSGNFTFSHFA